VTFQQRIFIALALCAAILFGYDLLVPKPPPPEPGAEDAKVEGKADGGEADAEGKDADDATRDAGRDDDAKEPAAPPTAPAHEIESHELRNDLLALTLTNRSPGRDGIVENVHLLSPQFEGSPNATSSLGLGERRTLEISFGESDVRIPATAAYEVRDVGPHHVTFGYRDALVDVEERVELLPAGYEARMAVKITNLDDRPQRHQLTLRTQVGTAGEDRYDLARGLCRTTEDMEYEDKSDVEDDGPIRYSSIVWGGVDRKYFAALVVPVDGASECEIAEDKDAGTLVNTLEGDRVELGRGESRTYEVGLYFGPKELERLQAFSAVSSDAELEEAIDWGFFGGLSKALGKLLLGLMRWFYGLVGSWGVAILLMTVVVKLLTLPLTLKQMRSMKRMKEIQPEMAKIKEKYADDRVKQGQEMQALFARSGANPLAGCLPMIVQMPIWFALYSMLGAAVELVHVPFLWLPDLTKQDPFYALPLALGALMILQNRLMPSMGGDAAQQKMMRWFMPIMFTVFMLFLPSGLGVYIFANILLSLVQTVIQVGTNKTTTDEPAAS
jgi:YidC/Oxa1 family membrane protein insertase